MPSINFELCAETLDACIAALDGGAHRVELCSRLDLDGLTPAPALVAQAIARTGLPIHAMIRPRPGDFVYSHADFTTMQSAILHMKKLDAAGVVLGILRPDSAVDVDRTRSLVALAHPMQVTFHRAFDATPNLPQALEDILASGCHRILTSGGSPNALDGAATIAALIAQANHRIVIAVGGGLRLDNASTIAHLSHATHFHGSLRYLNTTIDPASIRSLICALSSAV